MSFSKYSGFYHRHWKSQVVRPKGIVTWINTSKTFLYLDTFVALFSIQMWLNTVGLEYISHLKFGSTYQPIVCFIQYLCNSQGSLGSNFKVCCHHMQIKWLVKVGTNSEYQICKLEWKYVVPKQHWPFM